MVQMFLQVFQLLFAKGIKTCGRGTKVGMNGLPSPCRLDDEDWFPQGLLGVDPKGELRPDLVAGFCGVSSGTETGGQFAEAFPHIVPSSREIGYPDIPAGNGVARAIYHLAVNGPGRRILFHGFESANLGMAFHVGLAAKNKDLEGFGVSRRTGQKAEGGKVGEGGRKMHHVFRFGV